jgi:hypothetical protein
MAAKLLNTFGEKSFGLTQIELLYLDSVYTGNQMSLTFANAFADKYLQNIENPDTSFSNLYLKITTAKKDFNKALDFINKYEHTFQLWVEKGTWIARIYQL